MLNAHEINHVFHDKLHLCGCGIPETAARLVRDILNLCPLFKHREEFEKLLPNDGVQYMILGVLTDADLLEHGGGIGGSWLTDKGHEFLESLNKLAETDPDLACIFDDADDPAMWEMMKACPRCKAEEVTD